jgi:flagellar biosynthetic protein FliR
VRGGGRGAERCRARPDAGLKLVAELVALSTRHLEAFLLAFFRLGGVLAVAPVFGHRSVPVAHRAGLAALVALVVAPLLAGPPAAGDRDALGLLLAVGGELLLGAALGAVASLLLAAVEVAGELIGSQMGLGLGALYDPSLGTQATVVTRTLDLLALLLLLTFDGHHLVLQAVVGSFQRLPPGSLGPGAAAPGVLALGGRVVRSGLELAAPVVGILLVVNLTLALLTRVAPQANLFVIGLPITMGIGLFCLVQTLPYVGHLVGRLTAGLAADLTLVLEGAGRGVR